MSVAFIFKLVIVALLIIILLSLASGLFFLIRDRGESKRTAQSLTLRIVLSIALFVLLFVGYTTGLINPHPISPTEMNKALP